jgi:hypothetical protein
MKPKTEVRTNAVSAGVRLSALSRAGAQFAQVVAGAFSGRAEALAGVAPEDQDTLRLTPGSAAYDRMRTLLRADRERLAAMQSPDRISEVPPDEVREIGSVSESGRVSAVPAEDSDNSEVSALTTAELEPVHEPLLDVSPASSEGPGEVASTSGLTSVSPAPLASVPSGTGSGVSTLGGTSVPQAPRPAPSSIPSEPVDSSGFGGGGLARAVPATQPQGSATVMAGYAPSVVARVSAVAATGFAPSVVGRAATATAVAAQPAVAAGVATSTQVATQTNRRASVAQVKSMLPPPLPSAAKRRSAAEEQAAAQQVAAPAAPLAPAKRESATASGSEDGPDPIRTLTMARLLASQGYRKRALSIYDELLARDPNDAKLQAEAERLRKP